MSGVESSAAVNNDELLARFVLFSGWVRRSDNTTKQDAFIPRPFPDLDLSVTRHIGMTVAELWEIGETIAHGRTNATLYGRADIVAQKVRAQSLRIEPTLTPRNHANIVGWPSEKSAQKIIALELAAAAVFVQR
jgi:hypothetical protein